MKKYTTSKLFYGSYSYKVATQVRAGYLLKHKSTIDIDTVLLKRKSHGYSEEDQARLTEFNSILSQFEGKEIKVRYEGSHVNFFVKDPALFDSLCKAFASFIEKTWKPLNTNEAEFLTNGEKRIIVNKYPHDLYSYKVFLKTIPIDVRMNLYKWIEDQGDCFCISNGTRAYLQGLTKWKQDPFILIKSSKELTMLALRANDYIRRTEKYVLRSSINT